MAGGRPTKLNFEVQDKIVTAVRAGNYIETAAAYAGVNKSTLYDWLKRGAREKDRLAANPRARVRKKELPFVEFSNAVEKALADAEVRDVSLIAQAADEYWQAAAWRLERKFPDRWGKRVDVKQDVKQEVHGQVTHRHEYDVTERIEQYADVYRRLVRRGVLRSSDESNDPGEPVDTA